MKDLLEAQSHFAFGRNWRSFASLIDDNRIQASDDGINRLFPGDELKGKTVIDIGCGSGLPALSILRKGAEHITCIDIDPNSVAAANSTLTEYAPAEFCSTEVRSVFDLHGEYDVVYSWGVLHHTGDMWRAIETASSLVGPNGLFAIAIYGKGKLCGFWAWEKRLYTGAPRWVQEIILVSYLCVFCLWSVAKGRDPFKIMRDSKERGMDWIHDARDWLGGYPYESATPAEVSNFLTSRGFETLRTNTSVPNLKSGCDEFVFRRAD
jgi:2-polyprenyl-6-hydroxyphenyl methylase/3-demethylubiquinone-9 3-methyltransferase